MDAREEFNLLAAKRSDLEREIRQIEQLLASLGVARYKSLVDEEGFPLKDVDLFLVRSKRNELACTSQGYL